MWPNAWQHLVSTQTTVSHVINKMTSTALVIGLHADDILVEDVDVKVAVNRLPDELLIAR